MDDWSFETLDQWGGLEAGHQITIPDVLFSKLDPPPEDEDEDEDEGEEPDEDEKSPTRTTATG